MSRLGTYDIVYSWGVLHHTGSMWQALDNVKPLVKIGGQLFIAIYNDLGTVTDRWARVKRIYNRLARPLAPRLRAGHHRDGGGALACRPPAQRKPFGMASRVDGL